MKVAFLFDLDGVLVDSESEYTRIWEYINDIYPTNVDNFTVKIKGTTLPNILDKYYPDIKIRTKVENLLYELERKMVYRLCPGASELLDKLNERNVPIALVTSSNDLKMRHLFSDLPEFKSYFVDIIDDHKVSRSKPDPEGYILGSKSVGTDIRNCAVVEDSLQGVKAGRNAGAYVIGVAGTLPADILRPWCDMIVNCLEDINPDSVIKILSQRKS